HLDSDVPRQHDGEIKNDPGDPEGAWDGKTVTLRSHEKKNDHGGQRGRNRPFSQGSKRQKNVKRCEIPPLTAFIPGIPAQQCYGKATGERHVSRGGVRKSNHTGATGCNQRTIKFTPRQEATKKEINDRDQHGRIERRRQTSSPVTDNEGPKRN